MKRIKILLLLVTLLVLLVGAASAADVSDDTGDRLESVGTDTLTPEEVAVQEKSTPTMDVQENTLKSNKIAREEKTLKTATQYNVENYQQLKEALTNSDNDDITVNIKNNITLEVRITINPTNVTINGESNTINGADQCPFLNIGTGKKVTINNLTITNCNSPDYNGAIKNSGNLTVLNTNFTNNNGGTYAGVIYNINGTLTLNNTQFTGNTADKHGGAIYNYNGTLTIDNTEFTNNKVNSNGGAISNENGNLTVTNTNFTNNEVSGYSIADDSGGGAIYNMGNLTVNNTQFTNNHATKYHGGAIYHEYGTLTVNNTQFTGNTAGKHGGAIYHEHGTLTVTSTQFTDNNAQGGGAIYNKGGILTVTDAEFANNMGYDYGGAIYNNDGTVKEITNTIFNYNTNFNYNPNLIKGRYIPSNFIINESNNINLRNNDSFITVGSFTVMVDGEEKFHGSGNEQLNEYAIISDNYDVTLLLNGTDSKTRNNTFIIRSLREKTVHNYSELLSAIQDAGRKGYSRYTINLEEGDYNATNRIILNSNTDTTNITINGNGLTLDGNNRYQFISNWNNLTLENIIITNYTSSEGGAISNMYGGTLIITNSTLNNNAATGKNDGRGGAIYNNNGNLTITNSTFNNNTATGQTYDGFGGAIYNEHGNLTITDSKFTDNTATGENKGCGGAIYNYNGGTIIITNSTLNNNTVTGQTYRRGGAIYNEYGNLTITDSNLTYNTATEGGAIYDYGYTSIKITDSTFDMNSPINYRINDENHIQLDNNDKYIPWDATYAIYLDDETECVYTGPLNDYTVPKNHTVRLVVNGSDTSAFCNNTFMVYRYDKIVRNYTQLVGAVEDAKRSYEEEYYIYLLPGDYNATADMTWGSEWLGNTCKLLIDGNGLTLNGNKSHQFMTVSAGYNLTLYNITLTNYTATQGGAIYNNGTLNITDSNLTYNTATGDDDGFGGAVYNRGTLIINNSNLNNNTATGQTNGAGGAVYNSGTLNINNSNLNNNTATGQEGVGGAISNSGSGTLTITYSNFTYNTVTGDVGYGGAIYNYGNLTITDSNFTYNTVTGEGFGSGGAIFNYYGNLTITDSNFTYNTVTGEGFGSGGVIYNYRGTINITNSNFTQNTATGQNYGSGGAIHNEGGTINITYSTLNNNTVTGQEYGRGGAIHNEGGTINITYSNLTRNTITGQIVLGIAIYNNNGAATIYNNTFTNNLAKSATGNAIVDRGQDSVIRDNINADSSKYSSTIYTKNNNYGTVYPVSITFNTFDDETRNTSITISTNNTTTPTVTDTINITLELRDDFDLPVTGENITVFINQNKTTLTTDPTGMASMEYQLMSNKTGINAIYPGKDGEYNDSNTLLTLLSEKMETKLLVDDVSAAVGKAFMINGTLLDINDKPVQEAKIKITVNGSTNTAATNEEGKFNTTFTLQEMGEYNITAVFYETDGYNPSANNAAKVTATKTDTILTVDPVVAEVGDKVNLTAHLTDTEGNPVNEGKVVFKVNGATLKDTTTGKPIYAYLEDGTATIEYTVQKGWTKENTILSAVYSGNNKYTSARANNTITANYKTATIEALPDKTEYEIGSTIQIMAIVKDSTSQLVQEGTVIFKLNGKTLKDETGKTITATVNDGIAQITYTLNISAKKYTLTAVFSSKNYNRTEANSTFTVTKTSIHAEADPVIVTNDTPAVLTGKIYDGNNKPITGQVKVTVKINGITFADKVTVKNGIINIPLNESVSGSTSIDSFKMNRIYNVLVIIGDNSQYNGSNTTTILIKQ